ncbi:hypothetical protein DAI22_05g128401 [Oryza sativa Japonica Group]|nr:hypothetical protein DAI22_05g128401 [Oryza sativa Japonica Group]
MSRLNSHPLVLSKYTERETAPACGRREEGCRPPSGRRWMTIGPGWYTSAPARTSEAHQETRSSRHASRAVVSDQKFKTSPNL